MIFMKKTMIIGANTNPERYAYKAANMLVKYGHEIVPVGLKTGELAGKTILTGQPLIEDIDTVTLYLGPQNQQAIYNYVLKLKPKRVIFNPGTENDEFMDMLEEKGIEPVQACTLVMLSTHQY
jgi:predicted CoA-binding protein